MRPDPKPKKREKPKKKKRRSDRKLLEKECLDLWSLCVRAKDHHVCRYTNSDQSLSAHHIVEKRYKWGMFEIDNGLTLTWPIHSLQKFQPELFRDKVIEIIGEDKLRILKEKYMYRKTCRRSIKDLEEIKAHLKAELKRLEEL